MTESATTPAMPASMPCPICAATVDYDRRFTPWCAACDWNVDAGSDPRARPPSRLARRRTALARRLAHGSLAQVAGRAAERPPRSTPGTVALWLLSAAVIAAWVALLAVGVLWIVTGTGIVLKVIGVVMVVLAIVTRPRTAARPEHALDRAAAPTIYRLVDEIATELRAPRVGIIGVDGDWNAGTYRFGLRQQHAIVIGLPLWHALGPQERMAVLAHEIAHAVNGDTSRGMVQGTAGSMLRHWAFMTEPDDIVGDDHGGFLAVASLLANVVLLGISMGITAVAEVHFALGFPDSLRAEWYADRLGAVIGGRDAAVATVRRVSYGAPAFERALAAVTIRRPPAADLYDELRIELASTPPAEIERLRRQARLRPYAFDQTHPPTPEREAMLERLPADRPPRIVVTAERMAAIDAELATLRPEVTRELIDDYRDAVLA